MQKLLMRGRKAFRSSEGVRLTGRTQQFVSPLTGKLTVYDETYGIYVAEHSSLPPDLDALRDKINTDLVGQTVDGFCDDILMIQGIMQDTYKPRVWIAEEQPVLQANLGQQRLIAPLIVLAIIILIGIIVVAITTIVVVLFVGNSFTAISRYILQPPEYVGGTLDNPWVFDNFAGYLSYQHLRYWYVCPKCGAGFGDKTTYPNLEDVPQAEVDIFNEHVEMCLGIPTGPQNVISYLVWVGVLIAGGLGAVYIVGKVIESRPWAR